ncbi:hypothetical protein ACTAB1_01970 [Pseudomonas fragariae (ex Marin et al. 2024)]|uniref:hypothetical protein n=1 Tax=Pseudomonas TaxID=286 RepID=UPI000CD269EA|nr:hypothetical protein [Pseudomonas syringae]POD21220.1 hypothetical protein BKM12_07270 [Pseudomonas syringae pv. syringae]UQB20409.1 hypothetical protein I9H08_00615 [Pseudomonas syringae pv. syringae]
MKANWILAGIGIAVGTGVLVAIGVLGAYGYYLGPVSRQATDWGSFGSVMGGAFTLLSSFATIGTLLFLYLQQLKNDEKQEITDLQNQLKEIKHDEVVEKQLKALTFEQYLNHRKLFIERLNEQAKFFRGEIGFPNPERVYNAIFPKNSPSHCEYTVDLVDAKDAKAYDLTDCVAIYRSIGLLLDNLRDKEKHLTLIQQIVHMQGCLGISYGGDHREGDIFFVGINAGLNIYTIEKTLIRIENVINSILFYTGNEPLPQIHHKGQGSLIRDALYDTITNYHRARGGIEIKYENHAIPFLHQIYEESQTHFIVTERILEESYRVLCTLFSSPEDLAKLEDFDFADHLTDVIYHDINSAKMKYEADPNAVTILNRIESIHWSAMECLGVTE